MNPLSALVVAAILAVDASAAECRAPLVLPDRHLPACPSSPNCVSSETVDPGQRIAPLTFGGDPRLAFAQLRRVLAGRRDTTVISEGPGLLCVEFRTLLGFVDDGMFLLDPGRQLIQVRSASRLGYWDLGKNRHRLEEIRAAFERSAP